MADTYRIPLSSHAKTQLSKPIAGHGGHQTLLRRLQGQIDGDELVVSVDDMEKMLRYILSYGRGGFQQRIAAASGRKVAGRKKR